MRTPGRKNVAWETPLNGMVWQHVAIEVLMDIREELQTANRYLSVLHCRNFLNIPARLDSIKCNTTPDKKIKRKYKHSIQRL